MDPYRFQFFEENIIVGNIKVHPGYGEVIGHVEFNGTETEPGLFLVPVDLPDVEMPMFKRSRKLR
jgi:hypothetical protein